MIKNIIYIASSVIIFFAGVLIYGMFLNFREPTLKEALKKADVASVDRPILVAHRKSYKLDLFNGDKFIKTYKIVFGRNNSPIKNHAGDLATPIGVYKICNIKKSKRYYRYFHLNYPNLTDAAEALRKKIISRKEYLLIVSKLKKGECPPANTPLGSYIGIHGTGKYNFIFKNLPFVFNWTNGSIALSNEDIDELSSIIKIGDTIIIKDD